MDISRRRRGVRPGIAVVTAATLVATLSAVVGPGVATAASCEPTPNLLAGNPVQTMALPRGAKATVWDTGDEVDRHAEVRLAAVTIPAASLVPKVVAGSTLTGLRRAYQLAGPDTVALINGSVWDELDTGLPEKAQMLGGIVRKGDSKPVRALAVYAKTRTLAVAQMTVGGTAKATRGKTTIATVRIGAVNWQKLSRTGVTVYTSAWGQAARPVGWRTVVVSGGKVTKVLTGYSGALGQPAAGAKYLTAPTGSAAAEQLEKLVVGDKVAVTVTPGGSLQYLKKRTPIGKPSSLTGLSAPVVEKGKVVYGCSWSSEIRRPRSLIGWKKNGDVLLVAISGREFDEELRTGGATVHQAAAYLKQLGAVTAVAFDGGNSTTLLVRKKVGGPLIRLDRTQSEYQRPITDALAFDLP
jgi:hypothetical protein